MYLLLAPPLEEQAGPALKTAGLAAATTASGTSLLLAPSCGLSVSIGYDTVYSTVVMQVQAAAAQRV